MGPTCQRGKRFFREIQNPFPRTVHVQCVIRRNFLACEDIAGVSELSAAVTFFHKIQRPFWWVPDVRWRNHYFARNKEAFPFVRPWTQLSASPRTVHFKCMSVIDHVDKAAPRAPGQWTTARPRKGTTQSRGILVSGCPRGGEYEGLLVRQPSLENNRSCG